MSSLCVSCLAAGPLLEGFVVMRAPLWVGFLFWLIGPAIFSPTPSLRELADSRGMLVGTAARAYAFSEMEYSKTLGREFNMLESEDAMKWWTIRPDRATFNFTDGDRVVAFAEVHRMKVRGHNLVWGWTNPLWLMNGGFKPEELSQILQEHISKVAGHYRGKVFAWDVVNEAFDEYGKVKPSIWYDQPGIGLAGKGTAYLEQAFRWAHAADPDALLFYNDGGGEALNEKSDAIYAMVKDFKRRGVPIDGVGLQMHIFDLAPDVEGIDANIARFSALGMQIHITEMDVALPLDADGSARPADLAKQAEIYRRVASACLAHSGCTAIQAWGFTDKYSWIGSATKQTKGAGLLFDRNYNPKPAYDALREVLRKKQENPP
jgi:endo-1,4-beta-xylanase